MIKQCITCGQDFKVPLCRSSARYCSNKCRGQHRKGENSPTWKGGLSALSCLICGEEFHRKPSHIRQGHGALCSDECRAKWVGMQKAGKSTRRVIKLCQVCSKQIEVKVSHANVEGTYCSEQCMSIGYKTRLIGADNPNWKGGAVVNICMQCGRGFQVERGRLNSGGGQFCSTSCTATWRILNENIKGRAAGGKREDLGNRYFRSSWEANYARYLNWLVSLGEIRAWDYECDVFRFEAIKRGNMAYIPDFKITNKNDSIEYHEVKGYMDDDSAVKLRRMAKYYPNVKLILIDKDVYKAIEQQVRKIVPNWEVRRRATKI